MLVLSTFPRVRMLSTLVLDHAAAGRAARRRRTLHVTLAPPSRHPCARTEAAYLR